MNDERVIIADDARELVQRYGALVEQVAAMLGQRLRGEPVRSVRIERAGDAGGAEDEGIVVRVVVEGEIEEAQHVWERIEQDLGDLQGRVPPEQRRLLADHVSVVLNWSGQSVDG